MLQAITTTPVTRLRQILDYTDRGTGAIAEHLGINQKTLYRYAEGTRDMPLGQAGKMMEFCQLDPALLHNNAPLKRRLTGFVEIDAILVEIYSSPEIAGKDKDDVIADPLAHYYPQGYRCCSSTYHDAEPDRYQQVAVDHVEWQSMNVTRKRKRYSVNRAVEWASFCERVAEGQLAETTIVQADVINHNKLMVVARTKWRVESRIHSWTVSNSVETIDHLTLEHSIDDVCAGTHPFLIKTKLWTQYLGNSAHESMSQSCPKYQSVPNRELMI